MPLPIAYAPIQGQRYQILQRYRPFAKRGWEHCDYAKTMREMLDLLREYRLAQGEKFDFKVIQLPRKYWEEDKDGRDEGEVRQAGETLW